MQVHLVDGTYELFRAYYGPPPAKDPQGREVGAVRGLARSLLALVRNESATHIAVAFDRVVESFRNELFEHYKTGEGIEPELFAQFEIAERITHALGIVTWPMVEYEADDALATGARIFAEDSRVKRVLICSPDKDLAQCVRGKRVICLDRRRRFEIDHDAVLEKFGVTPESIPDWLALVGDSADGIPGVPRWGARSASAALACYERIEQIPKDPANWEFKVRGAAALSRSLNASRDAARLYRRLALLVENVPLEERLDDLEWRGARRDALETICAELGDTGLAERVPRWRQND